MTSRVCVFSDDVDVGSESFFHSFPLKLCELVRNLYELDKKTGRQRSNCPYRCEN